MSRWLPPLCLLAGIGFVLLLFAVNAWASRYLRRVFREAQVTYLPREAAKRRHPSNVVPFVQSSHVRTVRR